MAFEHVIIDCAAASRCMRRSLQTIGAVVHLDTVADFASIISSRNRTSLRSLEFRSVDMDVTLPEYCGCTDANESALRVNRTLTPRQTISQLQGDEDVAEPDDKLSGQVIGHHCRLIRQLWEEMLVMPQAFGGRQFHHRLLAVLIVQVVVWVQHFRGAVAQPGKGLAVGNR